MRLKTRSSQLETLITALHDDLNSQQVEINKFFNGKPVKAGFYEQTLVRNIMRQLREERHKNKIQSEEIEQLKLRLAGQPTVDYTGIIFQLKKECQNLRIALDQETQ